MAGNAKNSANRGGSKKQVGATGTKLGQKPRQGSDQQGPGWKAIVIVFGVLAVAVIAGAVLSSRGANPQAKPSPLPASTETRAPTVCENLSPPMIVARTVRERPYPMTIDLDATYRAEIRTSCGTMLVELLPKKAPVAVNNFVHLAEDDFYTGQVFHRIDATLGILQSGDPSCPIDVRGCGTGGPGYTIADEFPPKGTKPKVGTVAMASAGTPDSSGSQFLIVADDVGTDLPQQRTIFGQLVGLHSKQVAQVILTVPTKVAPNAPEGAPADYSDGEYVYIEGIKIEKT